MTFFALIAMTALSGPNAPSPLPNDADVVWPSAHVVGKPATDTPPSTLEVVNEKKQAEAASALERLDQEERSWTAQLVRTLLSLIVVIGLIYLIFKVVVPRFLGMSMPAKSSKSVRVVERTQLDARHAILLIEIEPKQRFLIATGEHGVQLLADLSRPGASHSHADFQAALARAAGSKADEDPHAKG